MPTIEITANDARIQYTASAGQTAFTYDFIIFSNTDITVVQNGTTLTLTTDYTVSGVGNASGGTVTLTTGATLNDTITIFRNTSIARASQYQVDGRFDAGPLERDLDRIFTILQEQERDITRAVTLNTESALSSIELPTASSEKFIRWNTAANALENSTVSEGDIVNAASNAAAAAASATAASTSASNASASAAAAAAAAASVDFTLADNNTFTGNNIFQGTLQAEGKFTLKDDGELTISSGAVTVTGANHTIDTESDAASDDLDTINGGADGAVLVLRAANAARTVVLKHNTGNIVTPDGADITLDETSKIVTLVYDAELSDWLVVSAPTVAAAGSGFLEPDMVVDNRYYLPISQDRYGGTLTVTANRLYGSLFVPPKTETYTRIGLSVSTGASGNARLGIFEFANGLPGALVLDAGTVSTTSTGNQEITISQSLTAGTVYVLACVFDATPAVYGAPGNAIGQLLMGAENSLQQPSGFYKSHTYGALPDPFGSITSYTDGTGGSASPVLWLRKV